MYFAAVLSVAIAGPVNREKASKEMGTENCFTHLLNSFGNFTASKLLWGKENKPALSDKVVKLTDELFEFTENSRSVLILDEKGQALL